MKKFIGLLLFSCFLMAGTTRLQAHPQNDAPASISPCIDQPSDNAYETIGNTPVMYGAAYVADAAEAVFMQVPVGHISFFRPLGQLYHHRSAVVPTGIVTMLGNGRGQAYSYNYCSPMPQRLRSNAIKV